MQPRYISAIVLTVAAIAQALPAQARDRKGPEIRHAPITDAELGEPIKVRAALFDTAGIFEATLYYRATGESEFFHATLVDSGSDYVATIPAEIVKGDVEYFVEAYDKNGNGPSRVGSPTEPLRISISREGTAAAAETKTAPEPVSSPVVEPAEELPGEGEAPFPTATASPEEALADEGDEPIDLTWPAVIAIGVGVASFAFTGVLLYDYLFVITPGAHASAQQGLEDTNIVCAGSGEPTDQCFQDTIDDANSDFIGMAVFGPLGLLAVGAGVAMLLLDDE